MAKVEFKPGMKPLRGKQGNLLFRKWGDGYRVSPLPAVSQRPATDKQKAVRQAFKQAAAVAKPRLRDDPVWKAACERLARERQSQVWNTAISLILSQH